MQSKQYEIEHLFAEHTAIYFLWVLQTWQTEFFFLVIFDFIR